MWRRHDWSRAGRANHFRGLFHPHPLRISPPNNSSLVRLCRALDLRPFDRGFHSRARFFSRTYDAGVDRVRGNRPAYGNDGLRRHSGVVRILRIHRHQSSQNEWRRPMETHRPSRHLHYGNLSAHRQCHRDHNHRSCDLEDLQQDGDKSHSPSAR